MNQTRIKWRGDDIVAPKTQVLAIGQCHFVRHVLTGKVRQSMSASNLHLVIDCSGMNIQGPAKQVREAQDVIYLIRVIASPCCDNCIGSHLVGFFWCDFRIGVSHRKDNRIVGHAGDHRRSYRPLYRNPQENIGIYHRIFQCPQIRSGGMRRFPLVHALCTALINNALCIAHDAVVMLDAHRL